MEARIILTHDCNYNCDFCHGEGWFKKKGVFIENTKPELFTAVPCRWLKATWLLYLSCLLHFIY